MADGKVVIDVELNDGSVVKGVADIDNQINKLDPSSRKADNSIKNMVTSLGLVKLASAGFDVLNRSLDDAITRFDTMERYPKVMGALGFSAEESSESVDKLADGIDGLPTKLDEVVSTSQRMTAITGNMDKSTDATLALNNAMLASGASTADASRGMDQYIQMLSKGEVDMQSWKTLQETMPIGLQKTAEAMGYVGETAQNDLYAALRDGEITFNDFQNQLIELGTGTGELAELARINSEGIATSFGNLKNATSKGLANIIKDLDELAVAVTGKNIAQNLDGLKVLVNNTFSAIGKSIQMTTPIIILSAKAFDLVFQSAKFLSPVLIGVASAYAALKIIQGINSLILGSHAALQMAALSGEALTIVLKAQVVATEAGTVATKAHTIAEMAKNGQITIGTALIGVLTGGITLNTVATTLATAATTAFSTALKVLSGPVGWVVAGIGALVTASVALWKWFKKDTEETAKLKKEQSELSETTKELTDSSKQNEKSRKESITSIESSTKANQDLVKSVSELADKEKLSAAEKRILKEQVEQLNSSYTDLNLKYDEETGKLSMSTEALNKKIEAYKETAKLTAAQEHLVDISKEQYEVDMKLEETAALRAKYNEQIEMGGKEARQAKKGLKELDETEAELIETTNNLSMETERMSTVLAESSEAAAIAVENGSERQVITYEGLSESQQGAVDRMRENFRALHESATDAFGKINTDSKISMAEMVENMNHNKEAVAQWGENQAQLLAWAGENGHDSFIPFIESIGVDQAGVLAEMVQGVDGTNQEQAALLEQLAKTYDDGFGTAAKAGKDSMLTGLEGLPDEIREMVITPTSSLNNEVKVAFQEMGENVGKGASGGIDDTAGDVEKSVENMAQKADDAFTGHMQIKSPSRLFKSYGEFIGKGLTNGIDSQKGSVTQSINMIVQSIKRPFDPLPNEMRSIGIYAMMGLNNGLINGSSMVYNTAQTIANNVKSIIADAMDINSPSRWMKNFVGKNMMIGWEQGLDQYSKLPVKAIKRASDNVKMPVLRAETLVNHPIAQQQQISNHTQVSGSSDLSPVNSLLAEQNAILKRILNKDTNVYFDDEQIAMRVTGVNALNDRLSYF